LQIKAMTHKPSYHHDEDAGSDQELFLPLPRPQYKHTIITAYHS